MIFACVAYLIQVILAFFLRRYFIYFFNEEYLGLNSLFTNVLSVLSLAELGFGTALVFEMYKPMADGDKERVSQLLHFYKTCYTIIAGVVLCLGLCVLPFMGYFQSKAPNVDVNLYVIYLIYLSNTVFSYLFAYRRSLLYASQRNDIESKVGLCLNVLSSVLQLLVLVFLNNYYVYIGITLFISIISNLVIYIITQKRYPEYVKKPNSYLDKESRRSINKNVFALLFHKIGGVVVYSTDSLVIYILLDSATLGRYSNYLLITTNLIAIVSMISNAMRGSIGNSIAKEPVDRNYKLLNKLNFIYFWLISFCTDCIFVLSDSFIDVVLTKGEKSLIFDKSIIILLSLNFFLTTSRYITGTFKECAGIFQQDKYKSLLEAGINLVASIVLVKAIGLPGVIIGTILSNLLAGLWIEPYVLNKYYLKQSTLKYFGKYLIYVGAMLITGIVTYSVCSVITINTIWTLIAKFAICAVVPNVVLLACLWWMPEFKECIKWGIDIIKGLKQKKVIATTAATDASQVDVVIAGVDVDKDGINDIETIMPVNIDAYLTEDNSEDYE